MVYSVFFYKEILIIILKIVSISGYFCEKNEVLYLNKVILLI